MGAECSPFHWQGRWSWVGPANRSDPPFSFISPWPIESDANLISAVSNQISPLPFARSTFELFFFFFYLEIIKWHIIWDFKVSPCGARQKLPAHLHFFNQAFRRKNSLNLPEKSRARARAIVTPDIKSLQPRGWNVKSTDGNIKC